MTSTPEHQTRRATTAPVASAGAPQPAVGAPPVVPRGNAWAVFVLVAIAQYGNFYVYDSIGPVADVLQRLRGFSDSQIGLLNAIYSLPNVVLVLVGGWLVDRYGAARLTLWTSLVCALGAALTSWGADFNTMAAGRLLFGIGAETFNIATLAAVTDYFAGGKVGFALGLSLGFGRLGSYSADMSPSWFAPAYAAGWQPPLLIATVIAIIGLLAAFAYWWIDRPFAALRRGAAHEAQRHAGPDVGASAGSGPGAGVRSRSLRGFGTPYWFLLALCLLWYAPMLAFRSTFAIKYFQHAHGLDLAAAGEINSYVFFAAIFTTPAFGLACDRLGRYAPMLALGALLLPVSLAVMALTPWSLGVATVLIGVSYSLVPAAMWPLVTRLVAAERLGTALGLMFVLQNAAIAAANVAAGWLNDRAGAGPENPAGYQPMMAFFGICGLLGFAFALALWLTAGRRGQERAMRAA